MLYPSIDKLLNIVDSKYMLVHVASRKAKQMLENNHYKKKEKDYINKIVNKDKTGKYITNIDDIINGYAVRTPVLLYADGYKLVEKSKFKPKIEEGTESLPK